MTELDSHLHIHISRGRRQIQRRCRLLSVRLESAARPEGKLESGDVDTGRHWRCPFFAWQLRFRPHRLTTRDALPGRYR